MGRAKYIAALVGALGLLIPLSTARAATYSVAACGDTETAVNNSWSAHTNDTGPGQLEVANGCGGSGPYGGLFARDALTCGGSCAPIPTAASAGWSFNAPFGTEIVTASYARWLYKAYDDDWRPSLSADGVPVPGEACSIIYPAYSCEVGVQGGQRTAVAFSPGASTIGIGVYCTPNAANNCVGGVSLHQVAAVLYGATVTLSDPSSPSISHTSGPLFGGGYLRGLTWGSFDASDNSGIRSSRLYLDGAGQPSTTYSCDFTYAVPCHDKPGASLSFDTRGLSDGSHSVQVGASDAAANEGRSSAQTITVDNGAPAGPAGLAVEGGDDWRTDDSFSVTWTNPANQVAPIAVAHHQVCSSDGLDCGPEQLASAPDITRIDGIAVPARGEWTLRVWLADAAGNVDSTHSASATLRFGTAPAPVQTTQTQSGTQTSTAQPSTSASTEPTASELTLPTIAAPLPQPATSSRRDPHLRLTSARTGHGHLRVRGRLATKADGRLSLSIRVRGATVKRTASVRGGKFSILVRIPRARLPHGSALARFAGNDLFRPARASMHF